MARVAYHADRALFLCKTITALVAERLVKDALSGKPGSVKELLERVDGTCWGKV